MTFAEPLKELAQRKKRSVTTSLEEHELPHNP